MLNIFCAANLFGYNQRILRELNKNIDDKGANNIIIVPDRFALHWERAIFETLNKQSLFNAEVLSLNRLAKKILGFKRQIDTQTGTMLVKKLLLDNREKLLCFKTALFNAGTAKEIFATINQLKSCGLTPAEILSSAQDKDYLSLKMQDLGLLYNAYEQYLAANNFTDSAAEFNNLYNCIQDNAYLKNSHIYAAGFDSFTLQGYKILSKLMGTSKSFCIGVVKADPAKPNSHIYLDDVYNNIIAAANANKIKYKTEYMPLTEGERTNEAGGTPHGTKPPTDHGRGLGVSGGDACFKFLADNLFSYSTPAFGETAQIKVYENLNFNDEAVRAAEIIRRGVTEQNLRYKDFNVAVSNLAEHAKTLQNVFKEFNISYFADNSVLLSDSVLAKFIKSIYNLFIFNCRSVDLISLCKNALSGLPEDKVCDFEDIVNKYGLGGKDFFKTEMVFDDPEYANFAAVKQSLKGMIFELKITHPGTSCHPSAGRVVQEHTGSGLQSGGEVLVSINGTEKFPPMEGWTPQADGVVVNPVCDSCLIETHINILKEILTNFNIENNLNNLAEIYRKQGLLKEESEARQYLLKTLEVLDNLKALLGGSAAGGQEFFDILESGLNSVAVSSVPLPLDCVFVGDISKSYFERKNSLIILGACEGDVPIESTDCGIISDSEIYTLSSRYKIEPTIKTVNARERFKLYNLVVGPLKNLHISYRLKDNDGGTKSPAVFVTQILKMYNLMPLTVSPNDIKYNLLSGKQAVYNLAAGLRQIYDGAQFTNTKDYSAILNILKQRQEFAFLKDYKNILQFDNNKPNLKTPLFFKENKLSVSEIERFYTCPYMHFLDYGLKLREKEPCEVDAKLTGNILHEFADGLFKQVKLPVKQGEIAGISNKVFDEVIRLHFKNAGELPQNKIQLIELKKEAGRLAFALNKQAEDSAFVPVFTEAKFGGENEDIKSVTLGGAGGKPLLIAGKIDRIDRFKDYFKIIDYKTGDSSTDLQSLYYGKKVQLYVYQNIVKQGLKLKPAGSYYLPVKSAFAEGNKSVLDLYKLRGFTLNDEEVIFASDRNLRQENTKSKIVEVNRNKNGKDGAVLHASSKLLSAENMQSLAGYAMQLAAAGAGDICGGYINAVPLVLKGGGPCEYCKYKGICKFDERLKNFERTHDQKFVPQHFEGVQYE